MLPPLRCSLLIKTVCWLQAPVVPILETFAISTPPPMIILNYACQQVSLLHTVTEKIMI